jgi:hypothetical protein
MRAALEALEAMTKGNERDSATQWGRIMLPNDAAITSLRAAITQAEQTRWYSVDALGMATLCHDQADAIKTVADNSIMWPNLAPHRAVRLAAIDLARGAGDV